jgi:hypothetical protein
MILAAQDLTSILATLAFLAVVALARKLASGRARAVFYGIVFLSAAGMEWALFPVTPVSYVVPFFAVLVFVVFVEIGAGRADGGRAASAGRDVREDFKRRRSRCRSFSLLPMVAGVTLFICAATLHETVDLFVNHVPLAQMPDRAIIGPEGFTAWVVIEVVIPGALLLGGLVFGLLTYRCPACGRMPLRSVGGDEGPALDPTECPSCGARLA